jgi:sec-independent protein translocase protein TatC
MLAGLRSTRRIQHHEEVAVTDHLEELRNRFIISLIALVAAFILSFWQHERIIDFLNRPLPASVPEPIVLQVMEPFMIAFKVSLAGAVILTLPVLIYQIYSFVVPAFDPDHERRTWPYLTAASLLFFVGLAFGYFLMLPAALNFLVNFDADLYNRQIQAGSYYTFVVWILIGSGLIFQLPSGVFLMATAGLISADWMRRNRRYAIFVLAVIAAALPGGDPLSMIIALAALLVLYEVSIYVALWVDRRKAEPEDGEPPPTDVGLAGDA